MGNFDFVRETLPSLHGDCARAESYLSSDPRSACFYSRRVVEELVSYLYDVLSLPIPVTPDQVGNFIQPGDHIDLIVHIGSLRATTLSASPTPAGATRRVSDTLDMPMTKLVVQNLEIIRVERDPAPRAAQTQANSREAARPGDVRRLYALVTRDAKLGKCAPRSQACRWTRCDETC